MSRFNSSKFINANVKVDGNEYNDCKFINCIMEFSGLAPVKFDGCSFDNVKWAFAGPAQATLSFMSAMYNGMGEGGKELIEKTFDSIKSQHAKKS